QPLLSAVAVDVDTRGLDEHGGPDVVLPQVIDQHARRLDAALTQHPLPSLRPAPGPDAGPAEVHDRIDAVERPLAHPPLGGIPDRTGVRTRTSMHLDDLVAIATQALRQRRTDQPAAPGDRDLHGMPALPRSP